MEEEKKTNNDTSDIKEISFQEAQTDIINDLGEKIEQNDKWYSDKLKQEQEFINNLEMISFNIESCFRLYVTILGNIDENTANETIDNLNFDYDLIRDILKNIKTKDTETILSDMEDALTPQEISLAMRFACKSLLLYKSDNDKVKTINELPFKGIRSVPLWRITKMVFEGLYQVKYNRNFITLLEFEHAVHKNYDLYANDIIKAAITVDRSILEGFLFFFYDTVEKKTLNENMDKWDFFIKYRLMKRGIKKILDIKPTLLGKKKNQ